MAIQKRRRNPELTRLYVAVALLVLIGMMILAYKTLGARVGGPGLDAPSRWALVAVGLTNVLAIGTFLFIVARSLAKLYFERRSGILGARLRTRLVLALFAVSIAPSLMLFLVGRSFISKNVERWFSPETEEVIREGAKLAGESRTALDQRLAEVVRRFQSSPSADPHVLVQETGADLVAQDGAAGGDGLSLKSVEFRPGVPPLSMPSWPGDIRVVDGPQGHWLLQGIARGDGRWVLGVLMSRTTYDRVLLLEQRQRESEQLRSARDTLETLPQSTFLFLTMLTLFVAVWTGLALARSLSEPIRALAKAAQRVGGGDLHVQLPVTGEDELAFLAQSFNGMTKDLRQSRGALEAQTGRLERQRAYLDQLMAALPVGILSWASDGELRTLNPAARSWLGLDAFNLEEDRWTTLIQLPRLGRLPELLARVRETGRGLQEEVRLGGEGEGRLVRAIVEPLQGGGVLAVLEDLTLLAQAEKRAAWQEVARRMAHEVKNPLTPIQLTAQRLLRRGREGRLDPDAVQEGAETILAEVTSLAKLVDSFTRFAKLPAPQFGPCDPCELLRQVAALYEPNHPQIRWTLDLPASAPEVHWDQDMVKRALINLVDNAVSAVQGVPEPAVRLALEQDAGGLVFLVEDDGPGVPEADRGRLFEPYFSTKRKGTGLGLAIVRRIAQDHGGDAFHEALDPGSRFGLVLPPKARGKA